MNNAEKFELILIFDECHRNTWPFFFITTYKVPHITFSSFLTQQFFFLLIIIKKKDQKQKTIKN